MSEGREQTAARKSGVVVVTHGSVLPQANAMLMRVVEELRRRLGTPLIEPCFMDLAQPDIPAAIRALGGQGGGHIFVYAPFLLPGRPLSQDIPRLVERELKSHAGVTYELTAPMMADAQLVDFIAKRVAVGIASSGN